MGFSTLSERNLSTRAAGHTILIVRVLRCAGIMPAVFRLSIEARSRPLLHRDKRDAGATITIEPLQFF